MSTPTSTTITPPTTTNYLTNLGLGYAIAIALGFLVLLSALLLSSYLCCRVSRSRRSQNHHNNINNNNNTNININEEGIIVPRIIFVAEDEDEDQRDDENAVVGLDQNVINSYPKFQYTRSVGGNGNNTTCSICLCEYKEAEMLRMMPECRHYFHLLCIDAWLKLNGSCPVCRNSPLPTPLSTPLSEVVPLSQYAADRRRRR